MKPFIRSHFNYDRLAASREAAVVNDQPSLTSQADKDDADINVLVRRFGVTGLIQGIERPPAISEFSDIFDFHSAMQTVRSAEESFSSMSADVRYRFANDPARFVAFCSNPENLPEMRKMGLAIPEEPVTIPPVPPVPPVPPPERST